MTTKELNEAVFALSDKFEDLNVRYIKKMGQHIQDIGKLSATDVHRIEQYVRMKANMDDLRLNIAKAGAVTISQLDDLCFRMIEDEYADNAYLYALAGKTQKDLMESEVLQQHIEAIKKLTANSFVNIANTTANDKAYQNLVDRGIYAVSNGLDDYNTAIRDTLKQCSAGARVEYASGITRRLDSAVRMNLLDGVRQIYDEVHKQGGNVFGADGYELSAHALCAPDHLPIQGRQFSKDEYDKMQSNQPFKDYRGVNHEALDRIIGQWNCKHISFPIVLGISNPVHSEEQLKQYGEYSGDKIEINGHKYSRYECSQLMRKAETAMRYSKDGYILAREAGDAELMQQYQQKLLKQQAKYREISTKSGLKKDYKRAYVPGYRGQGNNSAPAKILPKPDKPATGASSHKFISAKDASSTWVRRPDKFSNSFEDVIDYQKFNNKPYIVSPKKFDELVEKNNFMAQRTYTGGTAEIAKAKQANFYADCTKFNTTGLNARWGKGVYTFSNAGTTISDPVTSNIRRYVNEYQKEEITRGYAEPVSIIENLTLHKANVANSKDLIPLYDAYVKEHGYKYTELDLGSFAALKGFDAMTVFDPKKGDITIVYNRTKLVIQDNTLR